MWTGPLQRAMAPSTPTRDMRRGPCGPAPLHPQFAHPRESAWHQGSNAASSPNAWLAQANSGATSASSCGASAVSEEFWYCRYATGPSRAARSWKNAAKAMRRSAGSANTQAASTPGGAGSRASARPPGVSATVTCASPSAPARYSSSRHFCSAGHPATAPLSTGGTKEGGCGEPGEGSDRMQCGGGGSATEPLPAGTGCCSSVLHMQPDFEASLPLMHTHTHTHAARAWLRAALWPTFNQDRPVPAHIVTGECQRRRRLGQRLHKTEQVVLCGGKRGRQDRAQFASAQSWGCALELQIPAAGVHGTPAG